MEWAVYVLVVHVVLSILCYNYYRHHHYSSFRETRYFVAVCKNIYEKNFCVRYLVQLTVFIALHSTCVFRVKKRYIFICLKVCVGGQLNQSTRNVFELLCVVLYHLAPFQFMNINKTKDLYFFLTALLMFLCI